MKKVAIIVAVLLFVGCLPFMEGYVKLLHIIAAIGCVVTIVLNVRHGWCWENIVVGIVAILLSSIWVGDIYSRVMWVMLYVIGGGYFLYLGCRRENE